MPRRIIIIGAHAAGVDAAAAARKTDRTAEITLISKERRVGYSRCGIPFVIGGHIPRFDDLIVYPPTFYKMMKLNLKTETTVTHINKDAKTVETIDKNGKTETLPYDSLILATGASPFVPPIKGKEKQGVFVVRSLEDGEMIDAAIKAGAKNAVVIGAGLIGLEMGVAFVERGLKATVVELLPQTLPAMLDADMANIVQAKLEEKGLRIIVGKGVSEVLGDEKVTGVVVGDEQIPADILVVATGIRINSQLAQDAGIALGYYKGILTNMRMETNVKDIYAAGDCAETVSIITHRPVLYQLGTIAVRHGKVAGTNAAGGYSVFPGALGSCTSRMFDLESGATGLTEAMASKNGITPLVGTVTSKTRADYYPGALPIKIKLVFDKESEMLIGGQIVGGEDVTQRINALSFAIQKQMTLRELVKADTAYTPPLCETWEPMVFAAETALRKVR
ncbi:MAG: FAD-dependent oxidoreductase [Candidatus Bathyarchaeia archaeon]|nr:FAD-dependent oxidoreductase [Candidatus Bathyarchaeota archaeon A05DMB-4]MDH7595243.1 FAD-dependent oxidoreductase [Candidatus Bathyarchaeota archaeon]